MIWPVTGWRGVAVTALAVGGVDGGMVEAGWQPVIGVVTARTLGIIMPGWGGFLMTGAAVSGL